MKRNAMLSLAAACLLGLFSAQASAAQIEENSSYDSFAPDAVQDAVNKSGKTTVYIITDHNNCSAACGQMLQQFIYAQSDYPNIAFKGGTAEGWGIPKELLPFALVIAPNCGVIRRMPNFTPATDVAIKYFIDHLSEGAAMQPVTRTCH